MTEVRVSVLKCTYLHGQQGLAVSTGVAGANTSTTEVVNITAASWATGIWASALGAQVQFFVTSTGALVSSGADSVFTVTTVDFTNFTVKLPERPPGITALFTRRRRRQ